MATHAANKAEFDFSKLSVEDKLALAKQLEEQAREQGQKQFDETITFLGEKLKTMGRTKVEAVRGLMELMSDAEKAELRGVMAPAVKRTRAPKGTGPAKQAKPYVKGTTYKYQKDSWVGGSKGRRPPWLRDLIPDTMTFEEQKAKYEELAK